MRTEAEIRAALKYYTIFNESIYAGSMAKALRFVLGEEELYYPEITGGN